jgi:ribonucleotide reductase alpha subunit
LNTEKIIVEMLLDITNRLESIESKLNTIQEWTSDDLEDFMNEEIDIQFSSEALTRIMSDIFENDTQNQVKESSSKNVIKFPKH